MKQNQISFPSLELCKQQEISEGFSSCPPASLPISFSLGSSLLKITLVNGAFKWFFFSPRKCSICFWEILLSEVSPGLVNLDWHPEIASSSTICSYSCNQHAVGVEKNRLNYRKIIPCVLPYWVSVKLTQAEKHLGLEPLRSGCCINFTCHIPG